MRIRSGKANDPAVVSVRSHLPTLLLFGILSVLCSAGSAIVMVLIPDNGQHAPRTSSRHDLAGEQTIYLNTLRRPGYLLMSVAGPMPSSVADQLDDIRSQEIPTLPGDPRPGWLRNDERNDPQISRGIAAGWPFLCLWGRTDRNVNHKPQDTLTGVSRVRVRGVERSFPWRPLWLGFFGNAVVYTGAIALPWCTGVRLRQRWRRRRQRCPGCGYPIESAFDRCPECGKPFQPTAAASSRFSAAASTSSLHTTSTLTSNSSSNDDK